MRPAVTRSPRRTLAGLLLMVGMATGCTGGLATGPSLPPAEAYAAPSDFAGVWVGEIGGKLGTLNVDDLGQGRYYGLFEADAEVVRYVLKLEQGDAPDANGNPAPSNRASFTWQDGRGGRGAGWLLINREDTALTGEFGYGESYGGGGTWAFVRIE